MNRNTPYMHNYVMLIRQPRVHGYISLVIMHYVTVMVLLKYNVLIHLLLFKPGCLYST